jgi:hypothetical protein
MARQAWRSRRVAVTVAVGAAVIGVSAMFIVLGILDPQATDAAALPPIMPTADAPTHLPSLNSIFPRRSPRPMTRGPRSR